MSIREKLIRLAAANPALRPQLLPLLKEAAAPVTLREVKEWVDGLVGLGDVEEVDDAKVLRLAQAFSLAVKEACRKSSLVTDGPGATSAGSWNETSRGSFELSLPTGGSGDSWNTLAYETLEWPEDVQYSETVQVACEDIANEFRAACARVGVRLQRVTAREVHEFIHTTPRILFLVQEQMQELLAEEVGTRAQQFHMNIGLRSQFFEWPTTVNIENIDWEWVEGGVDVGRPLLRPTGVMMDVEIQGSVVVRDATASPDFSYSRQASLRDKLVRLAHVNPELRPHLLPLLKSATFWEGGPGGLQFDFSHAEVTVRTRPTDPYRQEYEASILTPDGDKDAYQAALKVIQDHKTEIKRLRKVFDVTNFVDEKVRAMVGTAPRWNHYFN